MFNRDSWCGVRARQKSRPNIFSHGVRKLALKHNNKLTFNCYRLEDAVQTLSASINLISAYFEKVSAEILVHRAYRTTDRTKIFLQQISSRDIFKWFYIRSQSTFTFSLSVHNAVVCISWLNSKLKFGFQENTAELSPFWNTKASPQSCTAATMCVFFHAIWLVRFETLGH